MVDLTDEYAKPKDFENAITIMNETLSVHQRKLYLPVESEMTSCHIIGAPRSGTTLLSQLLLTHLDLGYVNNFIAAYWKAPIFGIYLSKKLLGDSYVSNFQSDLGRTNNISEPHEFSYFWKYHLNYKDFLQKTYDVNHTVDYNGFKEIMNQMILAYGKPMLFKSFLLGFHAENIVNFMPKTVFVLIERDLIQNAFSILKFRKKLLGSEFVWGSMKPIQYDRLKNENKYRQVVGQVLFLNFEYRKQFFNIPTDNYRIVKYDDLCENPIKVLKTIKQSIECHDSVSWTNLESVKNFKETINIIPEEKLKKLNEAREWVLKEFPELEN